MSKYMCKLIPRLFQILLFPRSSKCTWASQDIDDFSLRKRVLDELGFLGTKEVPHALYGQPLDPWRRKETPVFLDHKTSIRQVCL